MTPKGQPELASAIPIDFQSFSLEHPQFDAVAVVGKLPNPRLRALRRFALTFAIIAGAGLGVDTIYDAVESSRASTANSQLDEASEAALEADLTFDRATQDLGEACVTKVEVYVDGASLADTPEGEIVTDLVSSPTQPCGEDPTEVRNQVRTFMTAHDELSAVNAEYDSAQETAEAANAVQDENGDLSDNYWTAGLGLVGLGAGWINALAGRDLAERDRRRMVNSRLQERLRVGLEMPDRYSYNEELNGKLRAADIARRELVNLYWPPQNKYQQHTQDNWDEEAKQKLWAARVSL